MTSITIKVPLALNRKLRQAAKARGETLSEVARKALERDVDLPAPDFAKLAAPFKGMYSGPKDLSTREGYGG